MKMFYKGAGVAIFRKCGSEYEILVGRRKYRPNKGKYSISGGGYESKDKNLKDTALRELKEETGIQIEQIAGSQKPIVKRIPLIFYIWETYMYTLDENQEVPFGKIHELKEFGFKKISELKDEELAFGMKSEIRKFLRVTKRQERKIK